MMDEHPHIRKTGRYVFYGLCAFGLSLFAHAACRMLHMPDWLTSLADMSVMFIAFLSLRDLEKNAEARGRASLPTSKGRE